MMNIDKSIKILVIACAALTVSLVAGILVQVSTRSGPALPEIALKAEESRITGFTITNASGTYSVRRSGSGWTLADTALSVGVKPSTATELLSYLGKLKALRLVANDAQAAEKLGLGAAAMKIAIKGENDGLITEYLVGTSPAITSECYVQIGKDGPVYAVESAFSTMAARAAADWADKDLWPTSDENLVKGFTVTGAAGSESYRRQEGDVPWVGSGSDLASAGTPDAIVSLLRQVLTLGGTAIEAVDAAALEARFAPLKQFFNITVETDQVYNLALYRDPADTNADYLVRFGWARQTATGQPVIITLPSWKVGDLKLRAPAAPAAPAP